jgi:hypothetical protein
MLHKLGTYILVHGILKVIDRNHPGGLLYRCGTAGRRWWSCVLDLCCRHVDWMFLNPGAFLLARRPVSVHSYYMEVQHSYSQQTDLAAFDGLV